MKRTSPSAGGSQGHGSAESGHKNGPSKRTIEHQSQKGRIAYWHYGNQQRSRDQECWSSTLLEEEKRSVRDLIYVPSCTRINTLQRRTTDFPITNNGIGYDKFSFF